MDRTDIFFNSIKAEFCCVWGLANYVIFGKLLFFLNMDLDSTLFKSECLSLEEFCVSD